MTAGSSEFRSLLNNLRARLDAERIPFAIGGSFATAARGYVRGTKDLDVMVVLSGEEDLLRVHRALLAAPTRFAWVNEVDFQDEETRLLIELLPVIDDAQRYAFDTAPLTPFQGAAGIRILSTEGIVLMLLRQATQERLANLQRIADIENLAARGAIDWKPVREWSQRMGYEAAYRQVRAPEKPPL